MCPKLLFEHAGSANGAGHTACPSETAWEGKWGKHPSLLLEERRGLTGHCTGFWWEVSHPAGWPKLPVPHRSPVSQDVESGLAGKSTELSIILFSADRSLCSPQHVPVPWQSWCFDNMQLLPLRQTMQPGLYQTSAPGQQPYERIYVKWLCYLDKFSPQQIHTHNSPW